MSVRSRFPLASVLIVSALLSTGVWGVFTGAAEHLCVWLMLGVSGAWAILLALGLLPEALADRKVFWATLAVASAGLASALLSGHPLYAIVYDSYAYMPWVVWAALLGAFLMAAKLPFGQDVRRGLCAMLAVAAVPLAVAVVQVLTHGGSDEYLTVLGNSNYLVSIAVMFIPIALGLAITSGSSRERVIWWAYAAVTVVVVLMPRTLIGFVSIPITLLLVLAAEPKLFSESFRPSRTLRVAVGALLGLVVLTFVVLSVPALNGGLVNPQSVKSFGLNVQTRADLWRGSQAMFLERPFLGFGPGGFKLHVIGHIDPWILGARAPSEPLEVAPPSPHSVVWTAATTFGIAGIAALCALLVTWVLALFGRDDASGPARALRLSLAVAFVAHVVTLLSVPVSPAQGLLPAVIAGLAIAPPRAGTARIRDSLARSVPCFAAGLVALVLAVSSFAAYRTYWSMNPEDVAGSLGRFDQAIRLQPGDPLYRFRRYEYRFLTANSDQDAGLVRDQFMDESGVLKDYAPGLVGLAQMSLDEAARFGRTDLSWERQLLIEARAISGDFPNLLAEELRVAAMSGDGEAVAESLETAKKYRKSYDLLDTYIRRVESTQSPQP